MARPPVSRSPQEFLDSFHHPEPPFVAAGAAVMILLREGLRDIETLLIERTVRSDDLASGQVSLPGGRARPEDGSLSATALREFSEEVGLTGDDLQGPPRFIEIKEAPIFSLRVGVFAALLAPRAHRPAVADVQEVAHVFWLPRDRLEHVGSVSRMTLHGPAEVDAAIFHGHVVWGFTLRVLRDFFGRVDAIGRSELSRGVPGA